MWLSPLEKGFKEIVTYESADLSHPQSSTYPILIICQGTLLSSDQSYEERYERGCHHNSHYKGGEPPLQGIKVVGQRKK